MQRPTMQPEEFPRFGERNRYGEMRGDAPQLGLKRQIIDVQTFGLIGENVWTVFTRSYQGSHWPGMAGLLCLGGMMFVSAYSLEPEPVLAFIALWLGVLCVKKARARANYRKGLEVESRFSGYPMFLMRLCKCDPPSAKNIECLFCIGLSMMMLQVHEQLGFILMVGAICLCVTRMVDAYTGYNMQIAEHDATVRMKAAYQRFSKRGRH